ncbi:hypothetical protein [Nocardioides hwasunensis]|uniref:Uncharacterized protein n=1 Tax=Nocardioides hwasunensis TaxID=397258 RepID=A0ABR8MQ00_9ACTN|nr:hypothetical protein [Nocardioides hwasunensis]MBD3917121.1 hypothetical protein [Nocardioides hwasunensis]
MWDNVMTLAAVALGWVLSQVTQSGQRRHASRESRSSDERKRVVGAVAQARAMTGVLEAIAAWVEMEAQGNTLAHPKIEDLAAEYNGNLQAFEHLVDEAEVLGPDWLVAPARRLIGVGDDVVKSQRAAMHELIEKAEFVDNARSGLAAMSIEVEELIAEAKTQLRQPD